MKKRLVIVIWNMGIGGIQKRMRDVAIDIAQHKKNWEITFLIRRKLDAPFVRPLEKNPNIQLMYYPCQRFRFPLGFVAWIAAQYIRLRPHVVLTFLAQLTIVMVIIQKVVFWQRARLVINDGAFMSGYLRFNNMSHLHSLLAWAYRFIDLLIVPTEACKKDLVARFCVEARRIVIVPSWTLHQSAALKKNQYDGVFIGRFELEKNPLAMVEVAELLRIHTPLIRLAMVGDGRMKKRILEQIKQKNLSSILQILPPHKASEALRKTRLLLVPSFNEGMPNVILEAAMNQVPSVALNFPGGIEVIDHAKTGYVVNTVREMEQRVRDLLTDSRKREQMGKQAQKHVQHNFARKNQRRFIDELLND